MPTDLIDFEAINRFAPRFSTLEAALEFQETRDYGLAVPYYIVIDDACVPNPEYINAPYEERIVLIK